MLALFLVSALMAGCSGMTPVDLRNNREEGPEKGLFSGSQGEFVIFRGEEAAKAEPNAVKTNTPEQ
jgi:hypothetical protein